MKWYLSAAVLCAVLSGALVFHFAPELPTRTSFDTDPVHTAAEFNARLLTWLGLSIASFSACAVVIALGCGAPGVPRSRR